VPAGLLAGCGVLFAAVVATLLYFDRSTTFYVVNGLPRPVAVAVEGLSARVASGAQKRLDGVSVGPHEIVVTEVDGALIERSLIDVRGAHRVELYNVAGAAPLVWSRVNYSVAKPRKAETKHYCGQTFLDLQRPDYLFEEPPASIRADSKSSSVIREALVLAPGLFSGCVQQLLNEGRTGEIQALLSVAQPGSWVSDDDRRPALELVKQLAAAPDDFELHRALQTQYQRLGQQDLLRPLYAARIARPEATDLDYYLYARISPASSRLALLTQGLSRFPSSGWLRWSLGYSYLDARDYPRALAAFEAVRLEELPLVRQLQVATARVSALLHLGRGAEALKEAERAIGGTRQVASDSARLRDLEFGLAYWAAAQAAGAKPNLNFLAVGSLRRWVELIGSGGLSESLGAAESGASYDLAATALLDPQRGIAQATTLLAADLVETPVSIQLLLLTEAWRSGDERLSQRLESLLGWRLNLSRARHFIRTEGAQEVLESLSDAECAVLWLARGRWVATSGGDPKPAYEQVRALDVFRGVAVRALNSWAEPLRAPPRWSLDPSSAASAPGEQPR